MAYTEEWKKLPGHSLGVCERESSPDETFHLIWNDMKC